MNKDVQGQGLDSDVIGEQIGHSVDRLLKPTEVIRGMVGDVLETGVFAKLARGAVNVALRLGWKPDYMYSMDYHDRMIEASTRMYLDRFGGEAGFNSMKIVSMGKEYVVRASSYKEGESERMGDWTKQVEYAEKFLKERSSEEKLRFGLEEAVNIVQLEKFFEKTRKQIAKKN